jgi:hypothetical protein
MSGPARSTGKLINIERSCGETGGGNRGATVDYVFECLQCGAQFRSKKKTAKFCGLKCSRDHYKSAPRRRICDECGRPFSVSISQGGTYSYRKTCSESCAQSLRRKHIDYESPERSKKLSDSCKALNSVAVLHTAKVREKAGPRIGDAKAWVHRTGRSALGISKTNCVLLLTSPQGAMFTTDCIRQFVRDNEHLFAETDLARRKSHHSKRTTIEGNMTCRAMCGLQEVARGARGSWKGWTCCPANAGIERPMKPHKEDGNV